MKTLITAAIALAVGTAAAQAQTIVRALPVEGLIFADGKWVGDPRTTIERDKMRKRFNPELTP